MFQSLVGFKINWNFGKGNCQTAREKFQSLVGFKINWNPELAPDSQVALGFNP
ncbi:hypothetical protein BFG60_3055 [Microcystis aeruginosa NIES-98]|nr:hypothetical protein BFG60_3055 [Microcystis aeruginosa NIES-98]